MTRFSMRLASVFLLIFSVSLGVIVLVATGSNTPLKLFLGFSVPSLAGLGFAMAWWRKSLHLLS